MDQNEGEVNKKGEKNQQGQYPASQVNTRFIIWPKDNFFLQD